MRCLHCTGTEKKIFLTQNQQFCTGIHKKREMSNVIPELEAQLQAQTPNASLILEQSAIFRNIRAENSNRYECMCTFVAFGSPTQRSMLMTCLMYALQPELIYSSYVKIVTSQEYETILLLKKKIPMDMIESFLDLFRMSTCVIAFDKLMSDEMATSIHRIHCGSGTYGNFHSKHNATLRRKYYYRRQKQKQVLEAKNVMDITGLPFSSSNMIRLYHELSVSRCENASLRARIQTFQTGLASLRV